MQQSVPFARISLFLSWLIFIVALGWVFFSLVTWALLTANDTGGGLAGLAGTFVVALPGIAIMILAAIGGVTAEMSVNQNRYQNVMLVDHE